MANTSDIEEITFHTISDPDELGLVDADLDRAATDAIMVRHFLATFRANTGKTLDDVADSKGVTKAAVHQLERRPLANIKFGSFVTHLQALGYNIDEVWLARTLAEALPEPAQ